MASLNFIIVGNERLNFKASNKPVKKYLSDRVHHFFDAKLEFVNRLATAEKRINEWMEKRRPELVVVVDALQPLIDEELVVAMFARLRELQKFACTCEGAIPGTAPIAVLDLNNCHYPEKKFTFLALENEPTLRWHTQKRYNNQFNLAKYKRLKQFVSLVSMNPEMHKLSIEAFIGFLESEEVFKFISSFSEDVRTIHYNKCPHCSGSLTSLETSMSQPMSGYAPVSRPLYHECNKCGLVLLSPAVHPEDVHKIYDIWDTQDFAKSENNPFWDQSPRCNLDKILPHLPNNTYSLDLGSGMGNFGKFLKNKFPSWEVVNSDFGSKLPEIPNIKSIPLNFVENKINANTYNFISAWEVIEHIPYEKLKFVFENIFQGLKPGGFFIFSTPNFDSPLCKSFDFFAIAPPFHYLVFGERWLRRYFLEMDGFEVFDVRHSSDFLDDGLSWYRYAGETAPSMAMRGTAQVLEAILRYDEDGCLRKKLCEKGFGTEVIVTLRKK